MKRRPDPVQTIVQEAAALPPFRFVFDIDELVPKPQRRLRPAGRSSEKSPSVARTASEAQTLIVQVVQAENVPLRQLQSGGDDDLAASGRFGRSQGRGQARTPGSRGRGGSIPMSPDTPGGGASDGFFDDRGDLDQDKVHEDSRINTLVQVSQLVGRSFSQLVSPSFHYWTVEWSFHSFIHSFIHSRMDFILRASGSLALLFLGAHSSPSIHPSIHPSNNQTN